MGKSRKFSSTRRNFLKGAAAASAATLGTGSQVAAASPEPVRRRTAPLQDPRAETTPPAELDVLTTEHCGSDFMVDILRSLDIEYVCANPGSSFRALHESVINYGGNQKPEFITCCHEESAMAWRTATQKLKASPGGFRPWDGRTATRRDGYL